LTTDEKSLGDGKGHITGGENVKHNRRADASIRKEQMGTTEE